MKSFKESTRPAHLAQQLSNLDNVTIANIIISVLKSKKKSAIFSGITSILQDRLDLLQADEQDDHPELF